MFRVLSCLTGEHDWRLVVLAGVVCLLASLVAVSLFHRARAVRGRARAGWLALAGAATGCGIWATHFIAMLAYQPTVPVAYDVGLTVLSLVAAALVTFAGLGLAVTNPGRWSAPIGGAIIGAGIASMHYTGMLALELPGHVAWSFDLVLTSIALGMLFGAGAMSIAIHRGGTRGLMAAAILLTLAIVSHHFTAMGAVTIVPDPTRAMTPFSLSETMLALAIAAAATAVLGMSLIGAIADSSLSKRSREFAQARRQLIADSEEKAREQNVRLDAALNNMSQGICMFDQSARVVVYNRRFLEMYSLSPLVVKPGCTLLDLIRHRKDVGLLDADPEQYSREILDGVAKGQTLTLTVKATDGRQIQAVNQPMPGGGWITTHEDVTERLRAEERLREQKLQLDTALNNMSQGLLMFDDQARLELCNQRYLQMYNLTPDQVKPGCTLQELLSLRKATGTFSRDSEAYVRDLRAQLAEGKSTAMTFELPDGRTMSVVNTPLPDGRWVSTHEDITEARRAEKERDRSQAFAATVIENVPATIMVKDARNLRYMLLNRAGEDYLGIPRDKMIGKTATEVFDAATAERIAHNDREILQHGQAQFYDEHPVVTPGGNSRIVATSRMLIRDPQGDPLYLMTVVEDRTHRKRAEAQIAHMAHHDSLTGLPNRAAFNECLASTIEAAANRNEAFALLSLDLDRFKEVNDVFGHAAGDKLLREVTQRLQATIGGAFLARLGGDEFIVIATDGEQPAAAEALADRLVEVMAKEFIIDGQHPRSSMSIGIAIFPTDSADSASLVANADAALYRAKREGCGTFRFFEPAMDKRLRERRALQHDLQSAIERGELVLHYQPQAKIGGEVTGFEALARWHHPSRGIIPPGTFVPLAEESGLILAMGEWILREACREAASWPKPLHIAINLSPVQFRHGDLPGLVHSVLLETGLAPSRLELEITEGVLIGDFSRAVAILRRLKALGVRIAMDDFGTGYSSLSYLQSFPFDKIKIDQAFISNVERNEQSATIIRAVIGLARGLKLPVVAEGVETQDQLDFLSGENCNEIQGYLIGRPQPIANYSDLVGLPRPRRAAAG